MKHSRCRLKKSKRIVGDIRDKMVGDDEDNLFKRKSQKYII